MLTPTRASSDMNSGAGLMKRGLSVPVGTILTINSFPDKTRLKYILAQDVISEGKARSSDGEVATREREKNRQVRGELHVDRGFGALV